MKKVKITVLRKMFNEDLAKEYEENIQGLTDKFIARCEAIMAQKEKDIMTVA